MCHAIHSWRKYIRYFDLYIDTLVDLMVREKGKVQAINSLPFRPCDGIKIFSWRQLSTVLKPRGLMHMGSHIRHLDGFLFVLSYFSTIIFGLRFV